MLPRLPPAIARLRRAGEYDGRVAPGEGVWGGMMLPDSLPILDNGGGDALLLRFAPDGTAREVVEWRHEGCLWHPTDLVRSLPAPDDARRRDAERALRSGGWRDRDHLDVDRRHRRWSVLADAAHAGQQPDVQDDRPRDHADRQPSR